LRAQSSQWKAGLSSRNKQEMEMRWRMSQQECHCIMDCPIAYPMKILQKEADFLINLCQTVDECLYDRLWADQGGLEDEIDGETTGPVTGTLQRVGT
jgi:hypothetical protein